VSSANVQGGGVNARIRAIIVPVQSSVYPSWHGRQITPFLSSHPGSSSVKRATILAFLSTNCTIAGDSETSSLPQIPQWVSFKSSSSPLMLPLKAKELTVSDMNFLLIRPPSRCGLV
jgi:hypothetical protein